MCHAITFIQLAEQIRFCTMDISLVSYQISKSLILLFDITPYFVIFSYFQTILPPNTITTITDQFLIDNIDIL